MALTQVSTKGLKDGTILNADVNASAAIAGTKISPDFGSQIIASTGQLQLTSQIPAFFKRNVTGASPVTVLIGNNTQSYALEASSTGFTINDYTNINVPRLAINSSGNVGIGIVSPGNLLHLSRSSTTAYSASLTTNDSTLMVQNTGAAGHATIEMQVKSSGTTQTGKATISATPEAASSRATSLTFGTRNHSSAMEERMRINSSGLIGIGTANPTSLLTLNHATSPFIRLNDSDITKCGIGADGGLSYVFAQDNNPLVFTTSTTTTFEERMRIATDGLITAKGDIRVDRGVAGVDGLVGQAYASYFGLKHSDQTVNTEYMMISNNSHTFISCTSGYSIYIRPSANSTVHETIFAHNTTTFNTNLLISQHNIQRTQHHTGHLEGGYNNIGGSETKTNPIFTIGSSYNPNEGTLSNMYGVGYSKGDSSFLPTGSNWGFYAAAAGVARIFLDTGSGQGRIYFGGNLASEDRFISHVTGDYGSMQISNGEKNGWGGYSIDGHSVFMSNGSATGDYIGIYDDNANSWVILSQRLSYTRLHHGGNPRLETTSAGVYITGTLTASSTKSFRISHPLSELSKTKDLVHAAIEGPQMDLMYRGKVDLVNGTAIVNIDTKSGMTEGTFNVLNRDVQCFTTNETGWTNVKGSVAGNKLTIVAEDNSCTDTISWIVIGERKDNDVISSEVTDDNGDLIVEPDKQVIDDEPKMDS